jgi:ABC-type phosphate transport system substrate-binding protein
VPENTLTRNDIQEIFLGKRVQWSDHSKIYAATVKDEVHKMFLKEYLNRTETKWRAYWKRMVFTGRGVPPRSLATEAELIAYIAETKGAVGYISHEGIQGSPEAAIKIIKIK